MFALSILFMAGIVFVLVSSSPVLSRCEDVDGSFFDCEPSYVLPANTIGYSCNPPIVDASNAPLPYTFKDATSDQKAVNRRIEKAMGRGECTYTDSTLQTTYDIFGPYLVSVYPPTDYISDEKTELAAQNACFVSCVDAKDQPTIDWCNANGCPIVGIDQSRVYMSPDGIVRYKEGDLVYNTYPCQNQYLTSISADLCPVLEGQDSDSGLNTVLRGHLFLFAGINQSDNKGTTFEIAFDFRKLTKIHGFQALSICNTTGSE